MNTISVVIPVYRDGARAVAAAAAMLGQALPAGHRLEVILVDDGSGDDTPARLSRCSNPLVRVVALPRNVGRSAARNAGAAAALGDAIVFMDCDCLPIDAGFVHAHHAALATGAVASTGEVTGDGAGFWSRYQATASSRRARKHAAGATYVGSSQNLAVARGAFERIGGFDTGYRHYGFEDRDLLLRLADVGHIAWSPTASVRHLDRVSLACVSVKMREAGEHSSTRFAARHPAAYACLGYALIDARRHPALRRVALALDAGLPAIARNIDRMLALPLPYAMKASAVRLVTALSYCIGTARSQN